MKYLYHLLLCLTFGLFAAACSEDNTTDPDPVHEHAEFAFFHAAAGEPSVDVRVDGEKGLTDRTFGIVYEGYTELEAGDRLITAVERSGGIGLAADTFSFAADQHYTIFLIKKATGMFSLLRFHDNLSHPPAGKALIRVAHLIPDGPRIKLAIPGSEQDAVFDNVRFMDNSEFFTPIDAGEIVFRVQDADNSGGGSGSTGIFDDVEVMLEPGKLYTIALVGNMADKSATAVVLTHEHE